MAFCYNIKYKMLSVALLLGGERFVFQKEKDNV